MKRLLLLIVGIFFIVGCSSQQPVAKVVNSIFNNPVLVNVKIDPEDPKSGNVLEDELKKMVINRLNLQLTENIDEAKSYILVTNYIVNTVPVTKDDKGNVIRYSVYIAMQLAMKDKAGFWSKNITTGTYVVVKAKSILSQQEKEKATKIAIKKGIDELVVAIAKRAKEKANDIDKNLDNIANLDSNGESNEDNNSNSLQDNISNDLYQDNTTNSDVNIDNETNQDNTTNSYVNSDNDNQDNPTNNNADLDNSSSQNNLDNDTSSNSQNEDDSLKEVQKELINLQKKYANLFSEAEY